MAAVKRTAQNTKKLVAQREKVNGKMRELAAELININNQIDAWETPIKIMTGGWTSEQCIAYDGNLPESEVNEGEALKETTAESQETNNVELI